MLAASLILAALALAAVTAVAWPLVARPAGEAPGSAENEARQALEEDLRRSLEAVREIEMDHRAGNLSDEDFAALDRAERARAVELMRRRDELAGGLTAPGRGAQGGAVAAESNTGDFPGK